MKHTRMSGLVGATIVAASVSSSAVAFNEFFAKGGPLSYLTESDISIVRTAVRSALDTAPDGNTETWTNPETKSSGTITPTKTFTKYGLRCRSVQFTTYAGGQSGRSEWTLCKTKDGWKIATGN